MIFSERIHTEPYTVKCYNSRFFIYFTNISLCVCVCFCDVFFMMMCNIVETVVWFLLPLNYLFTYVHHLLATNGQMQQQLVKTEKYVD